MLINTKIRTDQPEIMDDFAIEGEMLQDALDKIAKINRLLGGNKLTIQGVKKLISKTDKTKTITIADIGCGNGDMLRVLSEFAEKHSLHFNLIGIDANPFTIQYAEDLSAHYPNISYLCQDIFNKKFEEIHYDIVLCTLTLHHFKDEEILKLMTVFNNKATIGIVINDLQRSSIAYRLFQGLCWLSSINDMPREDGLTSILRGFKKSELIFISKKLNLKKYTIQWKWAFRYQWIIFKTK